MRVVRGQAMNGEEAEREEERGGRERERETVKRVGHGWYVEGYS